MIYDETHYFRASVEAVWDLLTNPEMTQQYMFGCAVTSDWETGSPVNWVATMEDGQPITYVKGEVLEYQPPHQLRITMIDPSMDMEDIPANYARLTYALRATEGGTHLQIVQDFTGTALAEQRYADTAKGWPTIIGLMRQLVEA